MALMKVDFEQPPLVEVAASLQFAPLRGLTSAHMGSYWSVLGRDDWPHVADAPRIAEQEERFIKNAWVPPRFVIQLETEPKPTGRVQFRNRSKDRMYQIQDTRFVYNWIKQDSSYPRYDAVRQAFLAEFDRFNEFVERAGVERPQCNQWELTYVNHIPAGQLWAKPADWHTVLPGLFAEPLQATVFESVNAEWRSEIAPQRGRLHIAVRCQQEPNNGDLPILVVHLTARGPLEGQLLPSDGLDIGHDAIVASFLEFTSKAAQEFWKRN